jgi:hypothetical protein
LQPLLKRFYEPAAVLRSQPHCFDLILALEPLCNKQYPFDLKVLARKTEAKPAEPKPTKEDESFSFLAPQALRNVFQSKPEAKPEPKPQPQPQPKPQPKPQPEAPEEPKLKQEKCSCGAAIWFVSNPAQARTEVQCQQCKKKNVFLTQPASRQGLFSFFSFN